MARVVVRARPGCRAVAGTSCPLVGYCPAMTRNICPIRYENTVPVA